MPIERLMETKKPRFVVDQILSSIQDGSLAAGERLPSEAKLAELTGVGRTSVREALAALRLMGVIETHVGNGSYVRETANSEVVSNGITRAIEQSEEAHQLQEARAVFECGLVRLAAARWSPEKAESFRPSSHSSIWRPETMGTPRAWAEATMATEPAWLAEVVCMLAVNAP